MSTAVKRHSSEALQIRIQKKAKNTAVPWQHQTRSAEHIVQQRCFCERPESQGLRIVPEPDGQPNQGQASGRDGTPLGLAWAAPAGAASQRLVLQGLPVSKKFAAVPGLHAGCLHTDRFLCTLRRAHCSTMQGHGVISSQPMSFRPCVGCKLASPERSASAVSVV